MHYRTRTHRCVDRATSFPRTAQARGVRPDESIAISLPTSARRGPAQARGAQPDESIAISFTRHACAPAHPALAHGAAAIELMPPHCTRREHR